MRGRILTLVVLAALLVGSGLGSGARPGASSMLPGYVLEQVFLADTLDRGVTLRFPTSVVEVGGALYVVEAGRHQFTNPYAGETLGKLVRIDLDGRLGRVTEVASGLRDPLALAVREDGTFLVSQMGEITTISGGVASTYATGYPPMSPDTTYPPGFDTNVLDIALRAAGAEFLQDFTTTGTLSLAFLSDGTLLATQGVSGRPPDDPFVGSNGYAVEYSSSVLRVTPGAVSPSAYVARGCRNCYDLGEAPASSPFAGRVFLTENTDLHRLRTQSGPGRAPLQGATAEQGALDSLLELVEGENGASLRRVATFPPNGFGAGAVPTGLAFAPQSWPANVAGHPVVAIFGGDYTGSQATPFRGYVAAVVPDEAGVGQFVLLAQGLADPTDLTFASDGSLYVVEYISGKLYRLRPG